MAPRQTKPPEAEEADCLLERKTEAALGQQGRPLRRGPFLNAV
jgi:hypothetical protein